MPPAKLALLVRVETSPMNLPDGSEVPFTHGSDSIVIYGNDDFGGGINIKVANESGTSTCIPTEVTQLGV